MFTLSYEKWACGLGAYYSDEGIFQRGCGDYKCTGLNIPVFIATGKLAGQVLPVIEIKGARVKVEDAKGKTWLVSYGDIELLDRNKQPIIEIVRDMTGRPIGAGDWVTYLGSNPRTNMPGLCIAQVKETNGKGELIVIPKMFDGQKTVSTLTMNDFCAVSDAEKTIPNTRRSLLLPIGQNDLMVLFMKDFERFNDE